MLGNYIEGGMARVYLKTIKFSVEDIIHRDNGMVKSYNRCVEFDFRRLHFDLKLL